MAYPNYFGYNSVDRSRPSFHPSTSFSNYHDYLHPTLSSFTSYPIIGCNYQEPKINQSFKNLFEDELNYLDDSIKDDLVSYVPPKDIVNSSFEEMYEDELIFLGIYVARIILCDNEDEFVKIGGEKKKKRKRKVLNKLERMRAKMTKRLTSPISPLKRTHWNDEKRVRGSRSK